MVACGQPLFAFASLCLTFAMIPCGISFFGPYWLGQVQNPISAKAAVEANNTYISGNVNDFPYRGLWAQCGQTCYWFWQDNYRLQNQKFTVLRWHLAAQVLYFVGAFMVLFCEIYARVQLCCITSSKAVYRSIGFILLTSFVIQAAAVAVFGGFANRDYGAVAAVSDNTYLAWCFWMTIAGGAMTLLSGLLFLFMDCCWYDDDD